MGSFPRHGHANYPTRPRFARPPSPKTGRDKKPLLRIHIRGPRGVLPTAQLAGDERAEIRHAAAAGVMSCSSNFMAMPGSRMMRFTSALSRPTMSAGVPAVVNRPTQATASNPGKPLSAMLGKSGHCGSRSALPVANGCSAPALIWASKAIGDIRVSCTSPSRCRASAGRS
jgi:hypothetical protein